MRVISLNNIQDNKMTNNFQSMYDCNLCDGQPVFANEREWSLHNAVLHFKPATSFAGRKRKSEENNDDDSKSGNDDEDDDDDDDDDDGSRVCGGDSNSSQKRKKWFLEKEENAGPDMTAFMAANRALPIAEHNTSAGIPPIDEDAQSHREEQQPPEATDGWRQSTSSPVPAASTVPAASPALSLSLSVSQSPLSQPGVEQLTETGEIDELSAAGLSREDLEESEREELRMAQERMDREMAERMQTEEAERARELESDRKLAEALQEREDGDTDESDPGEGPSGGRNKAASAAPSLNVESCQNHSDREEAAETLTSDIGEPKISSNDEMNGEVEICGTQDVDMADAPAENNAQETAMDSEAGTSVDNKTNPEGEGQPEPEQGSSRNRGSEKNSSHQHVQARKNDKKYNSSTLPRKLFRCNQCDPPVYFIVDALDSKALIDHMMETNHAVGVDEVPPLSVLMKFYFRDPWVGK